MSKEVYLQTCQQIIRVTDAEKRAYTELSRRYKKSLSQLVQEAMINYYDL